jgi:hypothetical protein
MSRTTLIASALVGAGLMLAPLAASAESPVFGTAKRVTLTPTAMEQVTGQGATADYYGQKGYNKLSKALDAAYWGLYYNGFNKENKFYQSAYNKALKAAEQLYWAWYYAGT